MPNLKIVQVENAVILITVIVSPAKSYMHIFNMLVTFVQSFNLSLQTLGEVNYTQLLTYYEAEPRNCLS